MRKEEAAFRIVWISVQLGEFVMNTMVACPVVNGALVGHPVEAQKNELCAPAVMPRPAMTYVQKHHKSWTLDA